MKNLIDNLFRGTVLMAPKWGLWIVLGGCLAAIGESALGLDPAVYKSIGLAGLLIGIGAFGYDLYESNKESKALRIENEARDAAALAAQHATAGDPYQTPPVVATTEVAE